MAREKAADIKSGLMPEIVGTQFSKTAKLPFTVASYQALLLYRASELAEVACDLYAASKIVSALTITRSLMEVTAKIFVLHLQVSKIIDKNCVGDERQSVLKDLIGTRIEELLKDKTDIHKSRNIVSDLKRVDKEHPTFMQQYDWLSDFAHPNFMGVFHPYGKLHPETNTLQLSQKMDEATGLLGLLYLRNAEIMFCGYYDKLILLYPSFNAICEVDVDIIDPLPK